LKTRDRDGAPDAAVHAAGDAGAPELLSAYAAGGLAPAEAARVEAYLADHPAAREELDEIARTLAAVRAAQPRPHGEPDWDAMAREIQRACTDEPAAPRWQLWRRLWARRPVALAAAGAVAVALVVVALSRGDDPAPGSERTAGADTRDRAAPSAGATDERSRSSVAVRTSTDDGARVEQGAREDGPTDEAARAADEAARAADPSAGEGADEVAVAAGTHPDLRAPVLGDLSSDELDRLEHTLDGDAAPEDAFVADLLAAGHLDGLPDLADRRALFGEADDDESPSIDPFAAPDHVPIDQLADELPDEAIEAIDRFLAEARAG
jgi:hypothetical protein